MTVSSSSLNISQEPILEWFSFFSGAAWAVYLGVAFLPFLFSISKSGDSWYTLVFLFLSLWALSGGIIYSDPDAARLIWWYTLGSAGLAGFLWANFHYIIHITGSTSSFWLVFITVLPPVAAAFLPFWLEIFGESPGFYPSD